MTSETLPTSHVLAPGGYLFSSLLTQNGPEGADPLRDIAEMVLNFISEAEAAQQIGAEPYERNEDRSGLRNGHRDRRFDTRLGTLNLRIPKLRAGGFVPSFIEHRKRSEQALISVIQEAVVQGVSTRKIEKVLESFGIAGVSAGQVSQLCAALDENESWARCATSGWTRFTIRSATMIESNPWRR